jgi:hypothetical protein
MIPIPGYAAPMGLMLSYSSKAYSHVAPTALRQTAGPHEAYRVPALKQINRLPNE